LHVDIFFISAPQYKGGHSASYNDGNIYNSFKTPNYLSPLENRGKQDMSYNKNTAHIFM